MSAWLDEAFGVCDDLDVLQDPVTIPQFRTMVITSLKGDARYNDVVRDIRRNPSWTTYQIRSSLGWSTPHSTRTTWSNKHRSH